MQLPNLNTLSNDYSKLKTPTGPFTKGYFDKRYRWAHIVTKESCPELFAIMEQCNEVLKPKAPIKLVIFESKDDLPNAFFSRQDPGCVFISATSIEAFNARDTAFTVGHESGHHMRSRRKIMKIFLTSYLSLNLSDYFVRNYAPSLADNKSAAFGLQALIMAVVMTSVSRSEEYKADQHGIDVVKDPEALDSTIKKIRRFYVADDELTPVERIIKRTREFISTHPSDIQRLEAAKKYAAKKGYIPNSSADKNEQSNAR